MREQLFRLTPDSSASLQTQLREMVVRAILDGHIPPGSALPSCRRLSRQLGIARNTVVLAYAHLVDDGYLVSRERSGYYVNDDILSGRVAASPLLASDHIFGPDWNHRLRRRASAQRNVEKRADWQAFDYPFIYGQFDLALFPVAEWRECSRQALSVGAIRRWAADSVDADDPNLIEQIHTRVLPRRGVWASPEEILITVGAQHALYLLASVTLDASTRIGMEDPGYPDARNIFSLLGRPVEPLPVDGDGLVISESLAGCDYVYVTPSHQYPTTVTMSMARRNELLRRSLDDDFIIIEDDYESEYNFVGEPTPALKSLDHSGRVVYIGSLSKTLAPGLRLGYMVGPAPLIREARALRRLMLRHPPANNQRAVALFLGLGHHDSLVRRLSHAFKERWEVMGAALGRYLPDSFRPPTFGGTSYWIQCRESLDIERLEVLAARESILFERGDVNFHAQAAPTNFLRLGFSSVTVERIEPGIEKLAELVLRCS